MPPPPPPKTASHRDRARFGPPGWLDHADPGTGPIRPNAKHTSANVNPDPPAFRVEGPRLLGSTGLARVASTVVVGGAAPKLSFTVEVSSNEVRTNPSSCHTIPLFVARATPPCVAHHDVTVPVARRHRSFRHLGQFRQFLGVRRANGADDEEGADDGDAPEGCSDPLKRCWGIDLASSQLYTEGGWPYHRACGRRRLRGNVFTLEIDPAAGTLDIVTGTGHPVPPHCHHHCHRVGRYKSRAGTQPTRTLRPTPRTTTPRQTTKGTGQWVARRGSGSATPCQSTGLGPSPRCSSWLPRMGRTR